VCLVSQEVLLEVVEINLIFKIKIISIFLDSLKTVSGRDTNQKKNDGTKEESKPKIGYEGQSAGGQQTSPQKQTIVPFAVQTRDCQRHQVFLRTG
jgi:hypothetical protein